MAAVEDLYARRVVGWSMADNLESRLVVDALALAVQRRLAGEGLLASSDRGSPYASDHSQRLLAEQGIICSMSRRADCWDNAPLESCYASLKKELVHGADFATRAEAITVKGCYNVASRAHGRPARSLGKARGALQLGDAAITLAAAGTRNQGSNHDGSLPAVPKIATG